MRKKIKLASGFAVAATFLTALVGVHGTGAFAEELVPTPLPLNPEPVFVAEPVVQALPAEEADANARGDDAREAVADADSLPELVSAYASSDALSREMRCLAGAIYFESRGESLPGQLAVGRVIVERAKSSRFPNSYCGVVFQRSQFSFVRGRTMPSIRTQTKAWKRAVAMARIADEGAWESPAEGALFFHATHVSPRWKLTRLARVDNHVFYR